MLLDCSLGFYFVKDILYQDIIYNILIKYEFAPNNSELFTLNGKGRLFINTRAKKFYMAIVPPHGSSISLKEFLDILKDKK